MKRHIKPCTAPSRAQTAGEPDASYVFLLDVVIGLLQYINGLK